MRTPWRATTLLSNLRSDQINLSDETKQQYEPIFWHSVCTEYDSRNFYAHLKSSNLKPTSEFETFLSHWLKDETNHTEGFVILYGLIYQQSETDIYARLKARPVDFSPLEQFFSDEFKLCLLLAYDEIVTTWVYHRSIPFYEHLGPRELKTWILKLKSDEALHFNNLLKILKARHFHRFGEAESILEQILHLDQTLTQYGSTFVLDHQCDDFSLTQSELVSLGSGIILKKLHSFKPTQTPTQTPTQKGETQ